MAEQVKEEAMGADAAVNDAEPVVKEAEKEVELGDDKFEHSAHLWW